MKGKREADIFAHEDFLPAFCAAAGDPDVVAKTLTGYKLVAKWLQSFKEYPPRQKPASFNLDEIMDKLMKTSNN